MTWSCATISPNAPRLRLDRDTIVQFFHESSQPSNRMSRWVGQFRLRASMSWCSSPTSSLAMPVRWGSDALWSVHASSRDCRNHDRSRPSDEDPASDEDRTLWKPPCIAGDVSKSWWLSSVWWRLTPPRCATFFPSIVSLKRDLTHVLHQWSRGIGSTRSMLCDRCSCVRRPLCRHVSCKCRTPWENCPTQRKKKGIPRSNSGVV